MKKPISDKFWDERAGSVTNPFGHEGTFLPKEDVLIEEMKKRMEEML